MAVGMKHTASNFSKLENFEGVDFRRWQKKMHFLLSSMSVVYVLTTPMLEDGGDNPTVKQVRKRAKWDNDDYVCRGLIINGMSDSLFDIYQNVETYKEHFKHNLKHLKEKLTLVELGSHLHIKESLRAQDNDKPKGNNVAGSLVINMCGKPGHLKKDCKDGNVGNKANGSGTKGLVDGSSNSLKGQNMFNKSLQVYYVTYVSEAYFVQDDDVAWWVDSGATVHVCKDRCWFKTYESLNDGSILHMGNESTALVHGRGCVDLRFSSGKVVSLLNVLHVPNIRKNLVSSSVLNNCGYKQVIESNKFVLSKHGVFIGFGYLSNHMFRLNIVSDNIGSAFMSTSKLNDSILWHARLGHVLRRLGSIFTLVYAAVQKLKKDSWKELQFSLVDNSKLNVKTKVNAATEVSAAVEFNVGAKVNVDYSNRRLKAPYAIKRVLRKNTENLNNKVIKLNKELSDCETDLYNYKRGLSQVEARLVQFKNNEIKFCERIRVLERDLDLRDNKIENLRNELEEVKKEKESIDFKIEKFDNASKDLESLLGNQRLDKDKKGLPEFVDDTVTDYSRPTPSIDVPRDVSESVSFFEQRGSVGNVVSKPMIRWMHKLGEGMSMINNLMQKLLLLVQKLMILLLKLKCTSERVEQRQKIKKKGRGFPE
ncbi:zinc finger, CCHC-type containing protein [Tanacetum coccineum]